VLRRVDQSALAVDRVESHSRNRRSESR
jgi:hypothetical protein